MVGKNIIAFPASFKSATVELGPMNPIASYIVFQYNSDSTTQLPHTIPNFPVPAAAQRKTIWQKVFLPETRTEGLDYERLARFNLTGALIHNIALNAAFLASQNGMAVTLPLVRSDSVNLGRQIPQSVYGGIGK
jgi:hypothetical protein